MISAFASCNLLQMSGAGAVRPGIIVPDTSRSSFPQCFIRSVNQ